MKKILNLKISNKGLLLFVLIFTIVAFVVARFPELLLRVSPGADVNKIHGAAEKLYTGGMMVVLLIFALAALPVLPLLALLLLLAVVTLGYHLYKKFI